MKWSEAPHYFMDITRNQTPATVPEEVFGYSGDQGSEIYRKFFGLDYLLHGFYEHEDVVTMQLYFPVIEIYE